MLPQSDACASAWYSKASDAGHVPASKSLEQLRQFRGDSGFGFQEDVLLPGRINAKDDKSKRGFGYSDTGNHTAFLLEMLAYNMARMYDRAERDVEAFFWYNRSVEHYNRSVNIYIPGRALNRLHILGTAGAMLELGAMYEDGRGLPAPDIEVALWYYIKALGHQDKRASAQINRVLRTGIVRNLSGGLQKLKMLAMREDSAGAVWPAEAVAMKALGAVLARIETKIDGLQYDGPADSIDRDGPAAVLVWIFWCSVFLLLVYCIVTRHQVLMCILRYLSVHGKSPMAIRAEEAGERNKAQKQKTAKRAEQSKAAEAKAAEQTKRRAADAETRRQEQAQAAGAKAAEQAKRRAAEAETRRQEQAQAVVEAKAAQRAGAIQVPVSPNAANVTERAIAKHTPERAVEGNPKQSGADNVEDHDKLCVVCMSEPKHVVLIPCESCQMHAWFGAQ